MSFTIEAVDGRGTIFTISPKGIEVSDGRDRVMLEAGLFRAGTTGPRAKAAKGTLNMLMHIYEEAATAATSADGLGLGYRDIKAASLEPMVYSSQEALARGASDKDLIDAYRRLPNTDELEVTGMWQGELDVHTALLQHARRDELGRRGLRPPLSRPELRVETLPPEAQEAWRQIGPENNWHDRWRQQRAISKRKGAEKDLYDKLPREGTEQRLGEQPRPVPLPRQPGPAPAPEGAKPGTDSPRSETHSEYLLRKLQSPDYSYTRKKLTGDGKQSGLPQAGEQLRGGEQPRPVPTLADRAGNRGPPITQPLSRDEVRAYWTEEMGYDPVSTVKDYWVERGEDAYDAYNKAKRALLNGG